MKNVASAQIKCEGLLVARACVSHPPEARQIVGDGRERLGLSPRSVLQRVWQYLYYCMLEIAEKGEEDG